MGTRNEDDTKVVLRKLFFCLLAFYVLYYTVSRARLPPRPPPAPRACAACARAGLLWRRAIAQSAPPPRAVVLCVSFGIFSSETWKLPFTFEAFESFSFSRKVCAGERRPPARRRQTRGISLRGAPSLIVAGRGGAAVPGATDARTSQRLAVAWISLASTYALSVGIVYYIVRCTRKAWDYSISVSILHLGLSCLGAALGPQPPAAARVPGRNIAAVASVAHARGVHRPIRARTHTAREQGAAAPRLPRCRPLAQRFHARRPHSTQQASARKGPRRRACAPYVGTTMRRRARQAPKAWRCVSRSVARIPDAVGVVGDDGGGDPGHGRPWGALVLLHTRHARHRAGPLRPARAC